MEQLPAIEGRNVPLEFVGIEDTPLIFANNFVVQVQRDEIVLMVGQVAPPLVIGTPEEQLAQLRELTRVKCQIVARFVFTRARLDELIANLELIRRQSDAMLTGGEA